MANSGNSWTQTIVDANLVTARAYTNTSTTAANTYAATVGTSANAYTVSYAATIANAAAAFAAANAKVASVTGTAGQIFSSGGTAPTVNLISSGVTATTYGGTTNVPVIVVDAFGRITSASNSAISAGGDPSAAYNTANAAFGAANSKVATVSGTSGRVTSSGTTAITLDLATAGPGAATYSSGISAITVDAYGRVTSVTGSASYLTGITSSQVTTALGYTPYNSTNPSGYITSSGSCASAGYVTGVTTTLLAQSPNNGSTGALQIIDAAGNPNAVYIQGVNNARNAQYCSLRFQSDGNIVASGGLAAVGDVISAYSDIRLKTKIGKIDNALEKLTSLEGFYYLPNDAAINIGIDEENTKRVGLSAQDVQKVLPEAVKDAPVGEGYLTVQYERLVPLLVEAIKELTDKVDSLENEIKQLKGK